MQPLLDGPRSQVPERVVRELLQSHRTLKITYGADALDGDFNFVADLSDYITGGSEVHSNTEATIHRTCNLNIDADVTDTGWSYLSGFVKPYMVFTDPQTEESARFNLGVYTLTTPSRVLGTTPATLNFQGYDLIHLLDQPIGDSFEVAVGVEPAQAAADVIGLAVPGIEVIVEDSGSPTATRLSWPFDASAPTTYLEVVQTLLDSVGYRPVWVDWEGRFRIEPYIDLQTATVEWTFDISDSDNIVSDDRSHDLDLFEVPNWWRFVQADLADLPLEGVNMFTWEDDSPLNPGSTANRGRRVRHIEEVPAVTYDDLLDYAQRRIAEMLTPAETYDVKTQPFPLAWHYDLIEFRDPALEGTLPSTGQRRYVVSTEWSLPLDGLDDMSWVWRAVIDQNVFGVFEVVEETYDPASDTNVGSVAGTFFVGGTFTGSHPA